MNVGKITRLKSLPIGWGMTILFLLTLAIRLLYIFRFRRYMDVTADEMERAAISLAKNGFMGNVFEGSPGRSAHVPPLYAGILAVVYIIFGAHTVESRIAQGVLTAIVTSILISLVPYVAKKAGLPPLSGWITGFLMAVLPLNLWIETTGVWEQAYSAMALILLLLSFISLQDIEWSSRKKVVILGVLNGVIALLSPNLIPASLLMFLSEFWQEKSNRKRIFASGLIIAAISLAFILPWTIRNYYALGGFVPIRSNFGLELAIGNNPKATGKTFITSSDDPLSPAYAMHPNSSKVEQARMAEIGELAYMREKQHQAVEWMKANPARAIQLLFIRFRLFWFPPVDMWWLDSPSRMLKSVVLSLISLAAFLKLIELIVTKHPKRWLLTAAIFGPSLIYMITHADTRYRYPIFGLSILLSASLVISLFSYLKSKLSIQQVASES